MPNHTITFMRMFAPTLVALVAACGGRTVGGPQNNNNDDDAAVRVGAFIRVLAY